MAKSKVFAWIFFSTTVALVFCLGWSWRYFFRMMPLPDAPPLPQPVTGSSQLSPLQVHFHLDVPGRGEIFPALANGDPSDYWPLAVLVISNSSDHPAIEAVTAQVLGWSEPLKELLSLAPHESRKLDLTPVLLPRAYQNGEMRRAVLRVQAKQPWEASGFAQDVPVLLHSAFDLYWGNKFSNAQYVARWVTPHDPAILRLVSEARRYIPLGRMPGYDELRPDARLREAEVRHEAMAVFDAFRHSGISYVSSIYTFGNFAGDAQRIRLPEETLSLHTANCIDVSVAYASALENIGIDPLIVIVPGHAFAGVRLTRTSSPASVLYLDLTVLPRGTFAQAQARAQGWLRQTPSAQVLTVDVAAARALGIYPMPSPVMEATAGQSAGLPSPEAKSR